MRRCKQRLANIAAASVLLLASIAPGVMAADWPQFQADDIRSGQTTDSAPVSNPVLKWTQYTWSSGTVGIESPPVVAGDSVYVHAGNGLWAFDKTTGSQVWQQTVPGTATLQTSTPACGDGKLFIATFDGYVRAYNALTGELLWEAGISDRIFQCPITYHDGMLYIGQGGSGGESNRYFCLDADTGEVIWEYVSETVGYLWSGASVVGDYLVFANHDAVLTSLDIDNGTPVDRLDLYNLQSDAGRARASVTYCNGFVYTTSESGLNSGYIWKIGYDPVTGHFDALSGWSNPIGFSTSTPVVHEGKVYVGEGEHGEDGSLVCLNDATGIIDWAYPVEGGVKSSPALAVQGDGDYLYFPTSMDNGFLYCIKGDGTLGWKWNPPGDDAYILQGAVVSGGMAYLGTCSGNLYALCSETGWPQFQRNALNSGKTPDAAPTSTPGVSWQAFTVYWNTHGIDVTPVVVNGKVIVIDCREKVWAFDIDSGSEIWSTQLTEGSRYTIGTPAAGEGKVFCATDGGYIYALEEDSGTVIWSGKLTSGINQEEELNTQVTYAGGKVYVGSWEGIYYCLDAEGNGPNPQVEWTYEVPGTRYDWYSAAAVIGDYVIFGNTDGLLVSLESSNGAPVDSLDLSSAYGITSGSIRSGISTNTERNRVYLSSKNGYVYAVGFDTLGGQFDSSNGWYATIDSYSQSTPAYYDGKIYVGSGDFNKAGALYCLEDATGNQVWRHAFGSYGSGGSPAISVQNGLPYIYVTTNDAYDNGGAYCFDAAGTLLWEYIPEPSENEMMLQGVAIAEGKVFFGNDAGWLYALGSTPAYPAWDVNRDGLINSADIGLISLQWMQTGAPGWIAEDVNRDGFVNAADIGIVGLHWGE